MSVRKTVNRSAIAEAALKIVKERGLESLSMRTLATALAIKAPSLYDHVKNRDEVVALIQAEGLRDFGARFAAAGSTPRQQILFYRAWALANPNLYPVVFQQRLQRELLPLGLEAWVLGQVVAAAGGSHLTARVLWAQLHGLVDLELQGRFPADADMDKSWEQVIQNFESDR
jgi:AcrR family transcriptional regulator